MVTFLEFRSGLECLAGGLSSVTILTGDAFRSVIYRLRSAEDVLQLAEKVLARLAGG